MIRDKIKNRDIQNIDDDIIRAKRLIRDRLCNDEDIVEILHNVELEKNEAPPDEYFGTNIFAFIRVPGVADTVQNYICFSIDDMEDVYRNDVMKIQYVQFVIFCNAEDINTPYGIERHDLLAYIIRDLFNWSDMLGTQMKLISNREGITDTNYYTRTLKFECMRPNSLQRGIMNNGYEFNKR
jgi:hypothetical protein